MSRLHARGCAAVLALACGVARGDVLCEGLRDNGRWVAHFPWSPAGSRYSDGIWLSPLNSPPVTLTRITFYM